MWTQKDLQRLEKAISSGTLKVKFSDKEVTYQTTTEMLKARQTILGYLAKNNPNSSRIVSSFDKGLC
ncbi:MAG: hypothetical protein HRU19_29350 [Pseudobacteriovorax sp.]|nr:hypothetical protein [Pseudobacteriovorax sp.]NRA68629.1 hypothetical protein [Pseudobacteriovorax sp.]